jgi:hypothetical protein
MKISAMVTIAGMLGVSAGAGQVAPELERRVTVCMDKGSDTEVVNWARAKAGKVFQRIGVKIEWQTDGRPCPVASGAIAIRLSDRTPKDQTRGALAYALPFEGTHIVVFYDRVRDRVELTQLPCLLAYVLVHEITHMLQGMERHSQSGIMKARWGRPEYLEMQRGFLGFAEEDVESIYHGLAWREHRLTAANSTSLPVVTP